MTKKPRLRGVAAVRAYIFEAPAPASVRHIQPIYWCPAVVPLHANIAAFPITGSVWEECVAGLGKYSAVQSMNGLVLYLPDRPPPPARHQRRE